MINPEKKLRNRTPKAIIRSCWNILAILILTVCLAIGADEVTTNPKAPTEAILNLTKKAESGDVKAQWSLALYYFFGRDVPKDHAQAVTWFRKAAEQGHAEAQYNLGLCYANGEGVPKDKAQAVTWFRKAAEQGYAIGQSKLGSCYAKGTGIPKDPVLAYMWFNLPASKGDANAVKNRDDISKEMTPEQIAEAQRLSREWKPTEAKK